MKPNIIQRIPSYTNCILFIRIIYDNFEYENNGYSVSEQEGLMLSAAEEMQTEYRQGLEVTVYYNPENIRKFISIFPINPPVR